MSPRPPLRRPVALEFAAMSRDGILYDSSCVQVGDFAWASRLVVVFQACDGYVACVENERG
eukprot:3726906-Alexandrium_andersonii.AAC.1